MVAVFSDKIPRDKYGRGKGGRQIVASIATFNARRYLDQNRPDKPEMPDWPGQEGLFHYQASEKVRQSI